MSTKRQHATRRRRWDHHCQSACHYRTGLMTSAVLSLMYMGIQKGRTVLLTNQPVVTNQPVGLSKRPTNDHMHVGWSTDLWLVTVQQHRPQCTTRSTRSTRRRSCSRSSAVRNNDAPLMQNSNDLVADTNAQSPPKAGGRRRPPLQCGERGAFHSHEVASPGGGRWFFSPRRAFVFPGGLCVFGRAPWFPVCFGWWWCSWSGPRWFWWGGLCPPPPSGGAPPLPRPVFLVYTCRAVLRTAV